MTTKQIAEVVDKDMSTVQRWVKKITDRMSSMDGKMQSMDGRVQSIAAKMSESTSTHPADFDTEETVLIIETGMGKNAAGIFRTNARLAATSAEAGSEHTARAEDDDDVRQGMTLVFGAIGKLAKRVSVIEKKIEAVPQIGYDETHMTVLAFCKTNDITCSVYDASRAGKEATRLSREEGVEIRTVPDDRFGKVNSYHKAILLRVFAL